MKWFLFIIDSINICQVGKALMGITRKEMEGIIWRVEIFIPAIISRAVLIRL